MSAPFLAAGFLESLRRFPERPAVEGERVWTYAELGAAAAGIAHVLCALPPGPAALLVRRDFESYAAVLGTLLAGRTYVPLPMPASRARAVLDKAKPAAVVVASSAQFALTELEKLGALPPLVVTPSHPLASTGKALIAKPRNVQALPRIADPAYLLFTSGTTGRPKGVPISHANVCAYLAQAITAYRPLPDDRFSQNFELTFDLSLHDMFLAWSAGACLVPVPDAARWMPAEHLKSKKLTFWFSTPSVAAILMRMRLLGPAVFPSLRHSLFCGEPLPAEIAKAWQEASPTSRLENLYGPTETTIAITRYRWDPALSPTECLRGLVPIGEVYAGHESRLLDAVDGKGELSLSGPQIASGYFEEPAYTTERFVPRDGKVWYRTGDIVEKIDDTLHHVGRVDSQIKLRGHRIELGEIDHALRLTLGTTAVAALEWPAPPAVPARVYAAVSGVHPDKFPEILAALRTKLPEAAVPERLFAFDKLPLSAHGKVDRVELRRKIEERLADEN